MNFRTQREARFFMIPLVAFALTEGVWCVAQTTQPAIESPSPSHTVKLKEGTEVKLKLRDRLTSKTAVEGEAVNLILEQDLKVGSLTVAKSGSVAVGTITHADKAGMVGRPGGLGVRLEYLKTDDSTIRLRGAQGKQGKGKEGTAVALTVLFGPVGLIKHGRNAELRAGTPVVAYVDQGTDLPGLN
jgi:predicted DNA-binding antitoxin AbrB/MazE fold protein